VLRWLLGVTWLQELVDTIRTRPELLDAFKEAAPETAEQGYIDAEGLRRFLVKVQRDERLNEILDPEPSVADCQSWIKEYETDPELLALDRMGLAAFDRLLSSPHNDVLRPAHRTVYQDTTKPLSSYYISSSHNTFVQLSDLPPPFPPPSLSDPYPPPILARCLLSIHLSYRLLAYSNTPSSASICLALFGASPLHPNSNMHHTASFLLAGTSPADSCRASPAQRCTGRSYSRAAAASSWICGIPKVLEQSQKLPMAKPFALASSFIRLLKLSEILRSRIRSSL